ncbi:MAG: hypothetical protein ACI9N1_001428 [Flavobacteriales bacterium]|jgi:hypothetical protein
MGMKNSIEAFPNDGVSKTIPVWVRVHNDGSYTFGFSGGSDLPSDMCLIFEDMVTGNTLDLKTATYYTFNMDSLVTFENRFNVNGSYPVVTLINNVTCAGAQDGSVIY